MALRKYLLLFIIIFLLNKQPSLYAQASASKKVVVVLGSSTSYGYLANPINDSSYVSLLRANLRARKMGDTIINLAYPDYTTYNIMPTGSVPSPDTGSISKPDTARNITKALSYKPNLVIINLPTNDIADYYSFTESINNYKVVVNLLTAANVPYIITSTQPRNFSVTQRNELRPFTNLLISTFPNHVVDYLDQLSNSDYTIRDSVSGGDGIHVNNKGHRIIYNAVLNFPIYQQLFDFTLPQTNFTLTVNSASCLGSNNGSVNIAAAQQLSYVANITGTNLNSNYAFTDTTTIRNLAPGSYSVCITATGVSGYQQCYTINITEPKPLSVYTAVNKISKNVVLTLGGGTLYTVLVNGVQYTTTDSTITLPLINANNDIVVSTDKECQGSIERMIDLSDDVSLFPVPFTSTLNINIGSANINNVAVEIHSITDGRMVYLKQFNHQSGVLQLDLTSLQAGVYALGLTLNNSEKTYKIMKR